MSRTQDPPHGFFPFGNPFKILAPKTPNLSPRLRSLLSVFEIRLAERTRRLEPKDKKDILTLSWMKQAIESLCETHNSIKTLITDLELPVSAWDEKWIDVYLDVSAKLLDLCNVFSSELTRLGQGHLYLQFALHNLESNTPESLSKARSSLDGWRKHIVSKNWRIDNCRSILGGLVESLNPPKVKLSAKGKVLMRALYAVKVETLYISGVFSAAFSGSSKDLLFLTVLDELPWAKSFIQMQNTINGEIKNIFLSDGFTVLKELDAVDANVKKLYPSIQDGSNPDVSDSFKNSISELSQGLDLVSKEVDCFFRIVLCGRNALLGSLRSPSPAPKEAVRKNLQEKTVLGRIR